MNTAAEYIEPEDVSIGSGALAEDDSVVIALVGNPNTGKSTLFNRLTGHRQRVGNYPGVTVEKREGYATIAGEKVLVVDLPGAYSLTASSADERVVVDFISGGIKNQKTPDVVVCVADATNLTRNLYLASQVSEANCPVVVALNMSDEAQAQGIEINASLLSERLGIRVVPTVATKGVGIQKLRQEIEAARKDRKRMKRVSFPENLKSAFSALKNRLKGYIPSDISEIELQRIFFDGHGGVSQKYKIPKKELEKIRLEIGKEFEISAGLNKVEPIVRYEWLYKQTKGAVKESVVNRTRMPDRIDWVLTNKFFGFLVFLAVMYAVFESIYTFAGPFMDFIDEQFGALGDWAGGFLESSPMLHSLVVDGIIAGVGGVVIFLPQILILFLFIAILEDSGYMARAAFLMDRIFGWCGLNGKSFVPLLSSFACAVPGIMAARIIEDSKARLVTILVAPLMSCSARLPVYTLFIAAFIEPVWGAGWASFTLFAMYFFGLVVAIPLAYLFNYFVKGKEEKIPFILEMPPYRFPQARDVLMRTWERVRHFLERAGTVILCMSIIVWALSYFPHPESVKTELNASFVKSLSLEKGISVDKAKLLLEDESVSKRLDSALAAAYMEQSYLGRLGKSIQPIFAPAGFDWKITVGVLASFPAREVIISTLGILYSLGGEVDEESSELVQSMSKATWEDGRAVFSPLIAIGVMVFFALCMQCGATVAVIGSEVSWKWASFAFVYMTALAWLGAVVVYQLGSLLM